MTTLSYLAAAVGGMLVLRPQMVWPLWPGCALLVAVLLLTPERKIWPVLIAAGLAGFALYDFRAGLTIRSTISLILADSVEVLIAALGVSYAFSGVPRLNNIGSLTKYLFFAVVLAPISAASTAAVALGGVYWATWKIGFLTEALAMLTLTPAVLSWVGATHTWAQKSRAYYVEGAALIASLVALGYVALVGPVAGSRPVLLYSLVPFLLWSALRFGTMGVSTSMIVVAFLSIWAAVHGRGFFIGLAPLDNVFSLLLFLLVAGTSFMILATLVEEYQQAEQALRESEKRFRLVANTAPVMIWTSGPDRLCDYLNQPWLDFTGRPLKAELGYGWVEGVHPDDLTACLDTYTKAFDTRQSFKMQYRLRRHDGEYRWLFDTGLPRFDGGGSFAGYIGSCIDITDRKLGEEALGTVGRRLLEAQEEERSRIARELHDDINQRMALLANGLQEFEQSTSGNNDSVQEKSLHELWQLANEIATDIQHISHHLHPAKLHYLGLATAVRELCQEFCRLHKIEVECVVRDLPEDLVEIASLSLFRTVQESLRNVVKHSHARHVKVELTCQSSVVHLYVSDDGNGFNPQEPRNNMGLGMISMRERLRSLGGEFSIRSMPSLGTQVEGSVPFTRSLVLGAEESAGD